MKHLGDYIYKNGQCINKQNLEDCFNICDFAWAAEDDSRFDMYRLKDNKLLALRIYDDNNIKLFVLN